MNRHYILKCEFGHVHGQCRCAGDKRVVETKCDRPVDHDPNWRPFKEIKAKGGNFRGVRREN